MPTYFSFKPAACFLQGSRPADRAVGARSSYPYDSERRTGLATEYFRLQR